MASTATTTSRTTTSDKSSHFASLHLFVLLWICLCCRKSSYNNTNIQHSYALLARCRRLACCAGAVCGVTVCVCVSGDGEGESCGVTVEDDLHGSTNQSNR
jgi:hypothetical protein